MKRLALFVGIVSFVLLAIVSTCRVHAQSHNSTSAVYAPSADQWVRTINCLASNAGVPGNLQGEVVDKDNPVTGAWTVYRVKDQTGRLIEVHSRLPLPESGKPFLFNGFVDRTQHSHYDSGALYVFVARSQEPLPVVPEPTGPIHDPIQNGGDHKEPAGISPRQMGIWSGLVFIVLAICIALMVKWWRFSGFAFVTERWKGTIRWREEPSSRDPSGMELHVVQGLSKGSIAIPTLEHGQKLTFGRGDGSSSGSNLVDIQIPHPHVGRTHGELMFEDGQWSILTGRSSNPTFLNGNPLSESQTALNPGDKIQIGLLQMEFRASEPAVPVDAVIERPAYAGGAQ